MNVFARLISSDKKSVPDGSVRLPTLANGDAEMPLSPEPPKVIAKHGASSRPKGQPGKGIALALGGGAAKGWAHIGILRAFDEAKFPISMIAGTSIGALVGACYLAGKLDELEEFALSLTKTNLIRYMDFSLRNSGLISGAKLAAKMEPHLGNLTIESLPCPFVAVATDIQYGHEVWMHDGPMIEAIRASYALPGVFQPISHNGRVLVDGALVNPVPVSACRTHETFAVIAVNLSGETFGRGTVIRESYYDVAGQVPISTSEAEAEAESVLSNWIPFLRGSASPTSPDNEASGRSHARSDTALKLGLTGVMMEAFNIIQDRIARSRLAGDPPDYTIRPPLSHIGLAEFYRAEEAIALGLEEGRRRISEFEQLKTEILG